MRTAALIRSALGVMLLLSLASNQGIALASSSVLQRLPVGSVESAWFIADHDRDTLSAFLVFNQGELHNPGTEGLAHYVEHLAWLNALQEPGAARHSNAWTNLYSTGYWLDFTAANQASRLQSLFKVVEPWTLANRFMLEERAVIEQEYNVRNVENPYADIERKLVQSLLLDTAYARSVISRPEIIRAFDLAEARALHARSHRLENATLLIIGNSSIEQLTQWLTQLGLPATSTSVASTNGDNLSESVVSLVEHQSSITMVPLMGLPATVDDQELTSNDVKGDVYYFRKLVDMQSCGTYAECDIIFRLLHSSIDSALPGGIASALRYDNFIARTFSLDLYRLNDSQVVMGFAAQPDMGVDLDALHKGFIDAWSATADGGIPKETIERIRNRIVDDIDSITDIPALALEIALGQLRTGRSVYSPEEQRRALSSVDYPRVISVLHSLHDEGRVVIRRVVQDSR